MIINIIKTMKKIFIILFIFAFSVFYMRFVLSAPIIDDGGHGSGDIDEHEIECRGQIDDMDGRCLGEREISRREAINMNNIINIARSFNSLTTDVFPNYKYLSSSVKEELIEKFVGYYDKNNNISTTTIESIPRGERDLFFKNAYTPYISLLKTRSIFSRYNDLGSFIQNMITLLNSTEAYIRNSAIDVSLFRSRILSANNELNSYINLIDSDISGLNTTISSFDKDNPDSFTGFIDSSVQNKTTLNNRRTTYYSVKDEIINLTVDAIRAVEIAYNGNSSIVASPNVIYSDGSSSSKVTVTVKNTLDNPIVNKQVTLISKNDGVVITPSATNTDISGVANFYITSTVEGYISLMATIEDESLELLGSNIINVRSLAYKGCVETGGGWKNDKCECPENFNWDEEKLECAMSQEPTPQEVCEWGGGSWDGEKCVCPDDYNWDEEKLECVKK